MSDKTSEILAVLLQDALRDLERERRLNDGLQSSLAYKEKQLVEAEATVEQLEGDKVPILEPSEQQKENHATAAMKIATKKACEESIDKEPPCTE